MVGELVFPDVIDGITEASDHTQAFDADHAQAGIDHRARIVGAAHARGAHWVEDRRANVARRLNQRGLVVVAHLRAREIFDRRIWP